MKHLIALIFFFAVATGSEAVEFVCYWPTSQTLNSIVPIESGSNSRASGVVVSDNLIITAAHVLENLTDTYAVINGELYVASVLLIDREADLALLSVSTENLSPIPLRKSELYASQEVWAVGFPGAQAQHTSAGYFNFQQAEAIHTSAGIDSGASGGGLLSCEDGEFVLAGMLRGYGAYVTDQGLIRLDDYSVSVSTSDIQFIINLSQNDY